MKNYDNKKQTISEFAIQNKCIRAEILWAYFTAMRNLSFLFTDHAKIMIPHLFFDSEIAKNMIINRKKTKKIIETVLTFAIRKKKFRYMKQLYTLMIDYSRDCSNKKEFMVATTYFDDNLGKIRRTVYIIVEQNQTSGEESYKRLMNEFTTDSIKLESCLAIISDNARDMIGETGLVSRMKANNNSILSLTCSATS